uniref:Pyrroloquinoline quinone-dependent pyranose dehydrogenase beta-propeller domain-containing protein n=1 Tax=Aplanochytrium stocchinoi TaxID=215587 RepID=A0A7S3PKT8_9STRA
MFSSVIAEAPGLNHGLAVRGDFLYASSPSTVYRWSYVSGQRTKSNSPEVIIKNMNSLGCSDCGAPLGHSTRTLAFDELGRLYVSVGSEKNVDPDSYRSRIRRFNL